MAGESKVDTEIDDIIYPSSIPFLLVHLACIAAIWTGVTWPVDRAMRGALLAAHLRGRRRLSSLFLAPCLRDRPGRSSSSSPSWPRAARKRACSGGRPSTGITICIPIPIEDVHSPRHKGFLYSHVGWIFYPAARCHRFRSRSPISPAIPSSCGCTNSRCVPAVAARRRLLSGRRLARPGGRILLEHGAALSRHLLHQFARACARQQALRDRRQFPQQLAAGVVDDGRRLAQQSSRLSRAASARASAGGRSTPPSMP